MSTTKNDALKNLLYFKSKNRIGLICIKSNHLIIESDRKNSEYLHPLSLTYILNTN